MHTDLSQPDVSLPPRLLHKPGLAHLSAGAYRGRPDIGPGIEIEKQLDRAAK